MAQKVSGNNSGLPPSVIRRVERLYNRKVDGDEIVGLELAREIYSLAQEIRRKVGVLLTREGKIVEVFLGSKSILYLPDLGRYRLGPGRLRRLRLIYSDLSNDSSQPQIPSDIYTDLEKLRLDMVISVKELRSNTAVTYAHIIPHAAEDGKYVHTEAVKDLARLDFDFTQFMSELEDELSRADNLQHRSAKGGTMLVGVYDKRLVDAEGSMEELKELARTAGVNMLGTIVQRREPDPRTLLGKGKLEEVVLECLRVGADMIIFDTELKPSQWRAVTNSTELKILDRSMLILDIFAQRATSSDGRLQVELAQLKYNLPRLVEKDAGLSRLTGGIGGRGPGETKLEIGRRRIRDRIIELEKRIDKLSDQRGLRRRKRMESELPLVCIVGYTNVGKSTLFNMLSGSNVIAENKLFATLDPAQRRFTIPSNGHLIQAILSDTVGFIRELPAELRTAFRATLEELNDAKLLIHVLDASDPRILARKDSVENVLAEMELSHIPVITVLNKCDKVEGVEAQNLAHQLDAVCISALKNEGLNFLKERIAEKIGRGDQRTPINL